MAVSTLAENVELKEKMVERKLVVHRLILDVAAVKSIVEKDKTKSFAKLGLFKPKREEVECESVQLFYEPFVVAKASYLLDYYKKKVYTVGVGEDVNEIIIFDQILKPEVVKEKGILNRPHKAITLDAQERVIYKAAGHMALNRTGREIEPTKLPTGAAESEPRKVLREVEDRVRELRISPAIILDMIRKRTARRPSDTGRIVDEAFEVTEYASVCTPIYEARCKRLKTGEIKIIPISGVTGKILSL